MNWAVTAAGRHALRGSSNLPSERGKRQARMLKAASTSRNNPAKKEPRLQGRMRAGRLAMIRGQIGDLPAVGLDTGRPTTAIHRLSYIARYRPLASPPTPRAITNRSQNRAPEAFCCSLSKFQRRRVPQLNATGWG